MERNEHVGDQMNAQSILGEFRDQLRGYVDDPGPVVQGFWVDGRPMAMISSLMDLTDVDSLSAAIMDTVNEVMDIAASNSEIIGGAEEVNKILSEIQIEDTTDTESSAGTPDNVVPMIARR